MTYHFFPFFFFFNDTATTEIYTLSLHDALPIFDLHAGGEIASQVRLGKANQPTGELAALGFDLRLDRFEAPSYESEFRVGYYEQTEITDERGTRPHWKLKASFDPDLSKHRLPGGDSFQLKGI